MDVVFPPAEEDDGHDDEDDEEAIAAARARDLRRYLPNVGLGKWDKPLTPDDLAAGKDKKAAKGFMGQLEEWFGRVISAHFTHVL